MTQYKNSQVVMLPTKQITNSLWSYKGRRLYSNETGNLNALDEIEHYHLYITSDDKKKDGDWCIHDVTFNISQHHSTNNNLNTWKKIIASTDPSLYCKSECDKSLSKKCICPDKLPQPSQEFIEYYISEYNKGNIITDVQVEYETVQTTSKEEYKYANGISNLSYSNRLKLSSDNTVHIKTVKDLYTREEVITLMKKSIQKGFDRDVLGWNQLDAWIQANL